MNWPVQGIIPHISFSSIDSNDIHSGPCIVKVFPLPVCPYANIQTLLPSNAAYTNAFTSSKIIFWVDEEENTLSKWNNEPSFHQFPISIVSIANDSPGWVTKTHELS